MFASLDSEQLSSIYRTARNEAGAKKFRLEDFDGRLGGLSNQAWDRLGEILGRNTHLKELDVVNYLGHINVNVAGLFGGFRGNQKICRMTLDGINLRDPQQMISVASFVRNSPVLRHLDLVRCNIGAGGIGMLADALMNRTEHTLERLNLSQNQFGDICLDGLVLALSEKCKTMRSLYLDENGIERRGCASLANLLAAENSKLRSLNLSDNSIDDESAVMLADSLATNTKLASLFLDGNRGISKEGWTNLRKLVLNDSGVNGLLNSNHTLREVGETSFIKKDVIHALGSDDASLLFASFDINANSSWEMSHSEKARRKIILSHASGKLNIGEADVPTQAMPEVLSWFGDDSNEPTDELIPHHEPPLLNKDVDEMRLDSVFRILRSMPVITSHVSRAI